MKNPKTARIGIPSPFSSAFPSHNEFESYPAPYVIVAGSLLLDIGQSPKYIGFVQSGIIKITSGRPGETEILLGLRSQGWWFNGSSWILEMPSSVRIQTVTDCLISKIETDRFPDFLLANPNAKCSFILSEYRETLMFHRRLREEELCPIANEYER